MTTVQILLGRGKHQLNAVELIDLAGAGIVVDGYDVGKGVAVPQLLDDAFSDHMVGQAGKGLGTYDVGGTGVDKL